MAIVTVVSAKHAPGTTTLAMLLASVADPFSLPLVLEADPAGGDLAARTGSLFEPGMGSVVSAARQDRSHRILEEHCRPLPSGVGVLVGAMAPHRVEAYLGDSAEVLTELLQRRAGLAVVDAGRWGPASTSAWAAVSDLVVVAMRPAVDSAEHVAVRLDQIEAVAPRVGVAVIGEGPLSAVDVADIIERPVWSLPVDAALAKAVCEGAGGLEPFRRTPLWLAAETMLDELLNLIAYGQTRPPLRRISA